MATRWLSVLLAGALAVGVGAAWVASDFRPVSPSRQTCRADVAYAVDVREGQATFDLAFEADARYWVILGSLADHDEETAVALSAEKVSAVERFPLRPVHPLSSDLPRRLDTSWQPPGSLQDSDTLSTTQTTPFVPQGVAPNSPKSSVPIAHEFYLHVTDGPLNDPRQYAKVQSRCVAEGQFVRVFLDSQMQTRQLAHGLVPEIVAWFDTEIVPGSRRALGTFRDVDGDGKFAILISPWLGKLEGGKTSLGGFVRGSDFQASVKQPFGNRADVLYLNSNLRPGPHLRTLLAHEFAHAVCFSERLPTKLQPLGLATEEDWLNEAIAHVAENLHGTGWTNLDDRVSRFLDATDRSPLVVPNYYADGLWRDPGCRGATYLFLRWVVDQFGEETLSRLIHNRDLGRRNLETATGISFADLFRRWTIALAVAGREAPRTGRPPEGRFTSLDLAATLGRWSLAGARAAVWDLAGEAPRCSLSGTTAKIFEVQTRSPGVYRLRVRSQGSPKLQVTVVRQPADWPRFQAAARWQVFESPTNGRHPALQVQADFPSNTHLKIVCLAVECRQGTQHRSFCVAGKDVAFRTVSTADGRRVEAATLNLPEGRFSRAAASRAEWQLKIACEDDRGRRAACWVNLPLPPRDAPSQIPPVAEKPGRRIL